MHQVRRRQSDAPSPWPSPASPTEGLGWERECNGGSGCWWWRSFRLMPSFECKFGNSGLVHFAQSFCDHAVVLFLGCSSQRQVHALSLAQLKGDAGILRRMCRREETGMLAALHVFAIV